jgi:3-hydroxybutyryl-CoA dehydrogenase
VSQHRFPGFLWSIEFLTGLGEVPTICQSAPGFVANRLQKALATEAIALVEECLATPAEVARIVKTSFGFRLGAYGWTRPAPTRT